MKKKRKKKDRLNKYTLKWIKLVYEKSWDQYAHEDNLQQSRNQLFLIIITAFLSACSAIVTFLLSDFSITEIDKFIYNVLIAGTIIIFYAVISMAIVNYWKRVTKASYHYVRLRYSAALEIEENYIPSKIGIAKKEEKWVKIRPDNYMGGSKSTLKLINIFHIISIFYGIIGLVLFIGSCILFFN